MKPLTLQGHSRPIKKIIFSSTGDLLYTASADRSIISWLTINGEKNKTYIHSASVNTLILSLNDIYLISGDNTGCTYIWDTKSATLLKKIEHDPILSVKSLDLIDNSLLLVVYAGRTKKAHSFINIYKFDQIMIKNKSYENDSIYSQNNSYNNQQIIPYKHYECIYNQSTKYVMAKFVTISNNKNILISREDGYFEMINMTTGKLIFENKFHDDSILDFDYFIDKNLVLSSGKDGTAKVFNLDNLDVISIFKPENPVRNLNTCKICLFPQNLEIIKNEENPEKFDLVENLQNLKQLELNDSTVDVNSLFGIEKPNINLNNQNDNLVFIVAGGQETKLVTTSKQDGGFDINSYTFKINNNNDLDQKLIFSLNFHFGPVNSIAYCPNKSLLASGSEDSIAKIYLIDNNLINSSK